MILIINICKEKLHYYEFVRPIEDIVKRNNLNYSTKNYKEISENDLETASKIIICGTSLKDNEFLESENLEKFKWVLNVKKPILGICGGSHIIGLFLGYKRKEENSIGMEKIKMDNEFLGINSEEIEVYHLHQFKVLPEIFQKDNLYATLFHPEVRNKKIIETFLEL